MFHTYVKNVNKNYKVIIDGDSCVNIIPRQPLSKMGLKAEPYSLSYNVYLDQ